MDTNNRLNGIFNSFISFSSEFSLENRLIDIFSSCFSFYLSDRKYAKAKKVYLCKLDELILHVSADSKTAVVVLDMSIKNQVAMSITYIHVYETLVVKMIHHAINVISTEAKLFTIRYGLNQATQLTNIKCIVIITDFIHVAKRIFDFSIHSY